MKIDYESLKQISLDPKNKNICAFDDSLILSSFLKLFSNIIYELQSLKINEVALFINSLNHWVTHKKYCATKKYKSGNIIEYECGLNYSDELSYRHTGLVLEVFDRKIVVIPSSSTQSLIDKSREKPSGLWYYFLVGKNVGFDHDCVLILNEMKTISKKRVIGSFGNITQNADGKKIFDDIKSELIHHYFSKQMLEKENLIKDLLNENSSINELNKELSSENELLQKSLDEKTKKINSLYWILNNQTDYYQNRKKQKNKSKKG